MAKHYLRKKEAKKQWQSTKREKGRKKKKLKEKRQNTHQRERNKEKKYLSKTYIGKIVI